MFRFSFTGLRFRLLLIMALTMVPILGLTLFTNIQERRNLLEDAKADTMRLVRLAFANQQQMIESTHQLLAALARIPTLRTGNVEECNKLLAALVEQYPQYVNISLLSPGGEVIASGFHERGVQIAGVGCASLASGDRSGLLVAD
ncbi:MAG: hypothetical protein ACLGPL_07160, partial [Acidobacteriota bacterium]